MVVRGRGESGFCDCGAYNVPDVDEAKWTVSTAGGVMPVWAHSGRELFYVNTLGETVAAKVQPGSDFAVTD